MPNPIKEPMCFSAQASFTTAAFLAPVGLYCLKTAFKFDKRYLTLAAVPLLFGIQQACEGGLWLALPDTNSATAIVMAYGFLFFADFLWPFLIPLACAFIETNPLKRQVYFILGMAGGLFGASLYFPLLVQPDWLSIQTQQGSIFYQLVLIYDSIFPHLVVRSTYILLVTLPLLLSSANRVRNLGWLLTISIVISTLFFNYAFVSVWCFFAAVLSAYIYWIIKNNKIADTKQ